MDFTVSLAGVPIGISSVHGDVYDMCKDYLCYSAEAFRVSADADDIRFEREKSIREAMLEGLPITEYSDAYLETLSVYRKIAVKMLDYDTFLMHGSAVSVNGEAYLFTARSGVGKTTHTRLWLQNIPGAEIVNGDKPLVRVSGEKAEVCGTPWSGKEGMNRSCIVPLKAICLLERSAENRICEVSFTEVYPYIIQETYRPQEPAAMLKTLELIQKTSRLVKFYRLGCNMLPDAALTAYRAMSGAL